MRGEHNELFSELIRPKQLNELTIKPSDIESLQRMVAKNSLMNMLFYGRAGTGKTSAARILIKELDADDYEFNGSHNNGDKDMINKIMSFSSAMSLTQRPKVVFIDEADGLSQSVQKSLRHIIETHSDNVRFIMTANEVSQLSEAIKSRCFCLCFDPGRSDTPGNLEKLVQRYLRVLCENGVEGEEGKIHQIVTSRYPDLRSIANALSFEFQ